MTSLELLGAAVASLWRSVVRRHAVRSDGSFPGFQLAAAAAPHVSLRQVDLGGAGKRLLAFRISARRLLDGGRQRVSAAHRSETVFPLPRPDLLVRHPEESAKEVLVRLIDAEISRAPRDKLNAPVGAFAKADHVRWLRRRNLARGRTSRSLLQGVRRILRLSRNHREKKDRNYDTANKSARHQILLEEEWSPQDPHCVNWYFVRLSGNPCARPVRWNRATPSPPARLLAPI